MCYLPKSMLNKFGRLRGTLKSTRPASDIGTLFNDPTKLPHNRKKVITFNTRYKNPIKCCLWAEEDIPVCCRSGLMQEPHRSEADG